MPAKMGTEHNMLKNLLMGDMGDLSYFKNLKDFLEEQDAKEDAVPQTCTAEMTKKITEVLEEEIGNTRFDDVRIIISAIQYTTHFPNHSSGFQVLFSSELINSLVRERKTLQNFGANKKSNFDYGDATYVFEETRKYVSDADEAGENASADSLMEVLLETINDVADCSSKAKNEAVGVFTEKLMALVISQNKRFHVRVEAVRTLNLLLEDCLDEVIEVIRNYPPNCQLIGSVANLLTTAGDFEMQVACTEALARLVKRSDKSNYNLINGWFSDPNFASAFMKIRDETFETDCRNFLNYVNEHLGSERSVYSFPCISTYLGSQKLKRPVDADLDEFWVDFNKVSHRITLYVAEEPQKENSEGGMWETVTIQKQAVKKFYMSEMGERQTLFMVLNIPASEFLASCSSDSQAAHISFNVKLDIYSAAVAVFGEERARHSKHKYSVSQVHVQVHRDDSSGCGSPGPMRYIRSADESSDSVSLQNAKIYGLGGTDEGNDMSGNRVPNVTSGNPARSKVSVPCKPMMTPSHYSTTDASSICGSVRSMSTAGSQHSSAFSGISVKPIPRKPDFAQPKTPVRTSSSSAKRVKTPLQITGADKATDSGNESAASTRSIGKKASISSGLGIGSCGTPSKLRQKLQQAGIISGSHDASDTDDGKTKVGHRSDPGLPSSDTTVTDQQHHSKLQNGHIQTDDGTKSDPTHTSRKGSQHLPKRQLRPRVPPKTSNVTLANQDPRETSASHDEDKKASSEEEQKSKTRSSRKFRLYSDRGIMMTDQGERDKELSNKDAVILSSLPTQERAVDVIPDSLPPSGQPLLERQTNSSIVPSRNPSEFDVNPRYPVAHRPSLSTLTEESTQSSRSKGRKIATSQSNGNELDHFKSASGHNKVVPTNLQEQIIEDDLQETVAVEEPSHRKSSHASQGKDGFDDKKRQEKRKSGQGKSISSGDADDEEDDLMYKSARATEAPKIGPNSNKIRDINSTNEAQVARIGEKTADVTRNVASPKSLPPSRAFGKVPPQTPESSQELSQLEFTSKMGPNPKKGRQRKNPPKVAREKKQPVARKGKTTKDPEENGPRAKSQRAASKAATMEIFTLSQLASPSADTSKALTLQFEPSSSNDKSPERTKEAKKVSSKNVSKSLKKSPSPLRQHRHLKLSQGPMDFSVFEYDSDIERSQSITFKKISPLNSSKKKQATKSRPMVTTQKSQDIRVYEVIDTDSCKETTLKQPIGRKKPRQLAKPTAKVSAQTKPPPKKRGRPKKQPPTNPDELSDDNRADSTSQPTTKKATKWPVQHAPQSSNHDEQSASKNHPRKKIKDISASSELSDIEQPRDVPRMSSKSLFDDEDDEEFHDEDVYNFVESFTNRQRQFLEKHFSGKQTTEAMRKLLSESRDNKREHSTPKSNYEGNATKTNAEDSGSAQEERVQNASGSSAQRQNTAARDGPGSSKIASRSKTSFGSEMIENESEDIVASGEEPISVSSEESQADDMISVDDFSKMCQSMIKRSGRGLAAKRSRRNVPKIDYRCPDSDSEPSDDDDDNDLEQEAHDEVASRSIKRKIDSDGVSERSWLAEKPKQKIVSINNVANDLEQEAHDKVASRSIKRKIDSDGVSERSWLAEKPKQKITTYSKTHSKEWSLHTSLRNREVATTVKKKKDTTKRRQPPPPAVPKKKMKKKPSKADYSLDNEDDIEPCMFYYREQEASIASNQPSQQVTDQVLMSKSHTSLGEISSNKTVNKSLPPVHTSTPSLTLSNNLLPSLSQEDDSSSIEVARDELDGPDDMNISPLTPLIMDEQIRDKCLANLVTPKALIKAPSISSRTTSSSPKKTPKQVTFTSSPSPVKDLSPVRQIDDTFKSGLSSWVRPTSSSLKRKYGTLFSDDEQSEDSQPELSALPATVAPDVFWSGQGALKPKKLFRAGISSSVSQEEEDGDSQGTISGDDASLSSMSNPSENISAMHITKVLKAVGENLKKKMLTKRAQTQQLTEGAVKTTQRQLSKLLNQQFQARNQAQENFKSSLLGEIVALENDLSQLQDMSSKMQGVLEQHHRKTASTLLKHVRQVKSLHVNQRNDSNELNEQHGRQLLRYVKQILSQELTTMQKKLVHDSQQHELHQMKKGLQTMFMF